MANSKCFFPTDGEHETFVVYKSEYHLRGIDAECTKKERHKEFIAVKSLGIDHLPEQHKDIDLYNFMRSVADLTVRIYVRVTSQHRPKFWPNTDKQYPFYHEGDHINDPRYGTGRVSLVTRYKDGYDDDGHRHLTSHHVCPCLKCQRSNSPSTVWWNVEVLTATHVVFDDYEGSHTTCRLFYDEKTSSYVTIDGVSVGFMSVERDWCRLTCVTCDRELGEKLASMKKECNTLWKKVQSKYYNSDKEEHKFMFLVSHPHGGTKQFSIGQWREKDPCHKDLPNCFQFTYETCTCPGSSGATVYCIGFTGWWLYQLVHSGSKSDMNYSNCSFVL